MVRIVAVALAALVVGSSCGRGEDLGIDEAVEILVIDGLDRRQAECVVAGLDGRLDLEKVTGVDADLDDAELALLGTSSAACAPAVPETGGVADDVTPEDLLLDPEPVDVDTLVDELVAGGMTPALAACVGEQVVHSPDADHAATDEVFLAEALLACDALTEPAR